MRADINTGGGDGGGGRCNPDYSGACIRIVSYDLDCSKRELEGRNTQN